MEMSIYLAQVLGIYLTVAGLGMLINKDFYSRAIKSLIKNEGLIMLVASFSLIFWSLVALKHNVWEGWPVIITIIAWIGVLKSGLYFLFPAGMMKWESNMMKKDPLNFWSIVSLALGLFLLYYGFVV